MTFLLFIKIIYRYEKLLLFLFTHLVIVFVAVDGFKQVEEEYEQFMLIIENFCSSFKASLRLFYGNIS